MLRQHRSAGRVTPATLTARSRDARAAASKKRRYGYAILSLWCLTAASTACEGRDAPDGRAGSEGALINRARALHDQITTIDSHGDIPLESCGDTDLQVDFPKMRSGGMDVVFAVVYVAQARRTAAAYAGAQRRASEAFQDIHGAVRRCYQDVELARTPYDVERIVAGGKLAVAIGIENGFAIGRAMSVLPTYADLGAAYLGLTHDGHNDIGDSAVPSEALGDGISRGRAGGVVARR